jgi:hypothetical protein
MKMKKIGLFLKGELMAEYPFTYTGGLEAINDAGFATSETGEFHEVKIYRENRLQVELMWELLKVELGQLESFYERTDDTSELNVIHDIQSLMNKMEVGEYGK